ncbi:hypothetical protein VTN49DRAFT_4187 [Thermomyces lanuginosus]|uniref:uncharacterized protein n=1 Tax=Thermomyces lanuginosus TaxID=5541 RepID=UPI0037430B01
MFDSANPVANPASIVAGPNYRFTVLTDRLLRYEWAPDGQFEDRASTFAINRSFPPPKFRVIDREEELEIITDYFHLTYDKKPFSPTGLVVHFNYRYTEWSKPWRYGVQGDDDEGQKFNLGGTARTLDLCDGRCDMGHGILSRAGYAVLDDSTSMLFDGDFVAARRTGAGKDRIDGYLFCYGHDYKGAIRALYALSGKQPVLPRFALGNWWSRFYAYHQDEYVQLMDKFRAHDIPLSVAVVDMDWHLVDDERVPHSGWTGYTWNPKLFPDPERFRQELHGRRLRITLNDHPHSGIHHHEGYYEAMAQALGHDTTHKAPILFEPTNPKFMKAYLEVLHRELEKVCCDFWWIDWQQGTYSKVPGFDPLWLLNHFHFLDHKRTRGGDNGALIFSRYAGPGSHRYPVGFSGDTVVSWASLAFQPEFTATASNIGYGWWSHDIGGHLFGGRDDELVTRWVQLGVFSPILRLHSTRSRWMSKEPWLYRLECEAVISAALRFRHRLVPFLHTRNVLGSNEDEPLIQPMYWAYPDKDEAYTVPNQYLFGKDLLVAPIVQPRNPKTNLATVKAWLPGNGRHPHRYVDIFTGTVYDADREIILHRRLDEYPVFAAEGTIIPLDADYAPRNGCINPDVFEFLIVVGDDAQARVIEDTVDDENSNNSTHSRRELTITYTQSDGRVTVTGLDRHRRARFRFLSVTTAPDSLRVHANGTDRTADATVTAITAADTQGNTQPPSLLIDCTGVTPEEETYTITVDLGPNPQLSVIDPTPRLERLLRDYQCEFKTKDRLWDVIESSRKRGVNTTLGTLTALGYDKELVEPVAELLLADMRLYSDSK